MTESDYPIFKEKTEKIDTNELVDVASNMIGYLTQLEADATSRADIGAEIEKCLAGYCEKFCLRSEELFTLTIRRDALLKSVMAVPEELGQGLYAVLRDVSMLTPKLLALQLPDGTTDPYIGLVLELPPNEKNGLRRMLEVPVTAVVSMERFTGIE